VPHVTVPDESFDTGEQDYFAEKNSTFHHRSVRDHQRWLCIGGNFIL